MKGLEARSLEGLVLMLKAFMTCHNYEGMAMTSLNISLPEHLKQYVEGKLRRVTGHPERVHPRVDSPKQGASASLARTGTYCSR
jgi:hypothetical protein